MAQEELEIPEYESTAMKRMRQLSGGDNDSKSRELARYIQEIAGQYEENLQVVLIYRSDRMLRGGDQMSFQKRGFTAVRLTAYYENYLHQHQDVRKVKGIQYGDLPEFMDFGYLGKITRLNLATLASLANAPSVPRQVKINLSGLTNFTSIYWKAPRIGKVRGFLVLMRASDQPNWQREYFTSEPELTVPFSKDNYLFAVQAVGTNGLKSQAVFPEIVP